MAVFKVKVIQNYRVTRTIVMHVEADSIESEVENVALGAEDTPVLEHPDWRTGWDLQDEHVKAG